MNYEENKTLNKNKFLKLVPKNSIIILNDWIYLWKPDLGENGVLVAIDNDLSDIKLYDIEFDKIQHIKSTKEIWNSQNYDFDKEFPDDFYRD